MKQMLAAAAAVIVATAAGSVLAHEGPHATPNDGLTWGPAPAVFPAGAQMAVLSGNPGSTGLFTVRLRMPANYKIPVHTHPTDEIVTVIDGGLGLGMGDAFDPEHGMTLKPGGFAVAPAHMNHFAWSQGGAVVQITAEGPFAMTYANPVDDPTKR
jgi:quercetin dioxygenase-like cupin family protein